MNPNIKKIIIIVAVNIITTFVLFYLFEENKQCITDLGSRCSNLFLIRCTIQVIVLTLVMNYTMKPKKTEKQ